MIVAVGVHVPAGILDRDEDAAPLTQPAGQQQLSAQCRGTKLLESSRELGRIVAGQQLGVLLTQVEGPSSLTQNQFERLLFKPVQP